jgi:hypothetical protein
VNALADQWLSQPRRKRRGYAKTIHTKVFLNFVKNGQKRTITLTVAVSYIFHTPPEKCVKNVSQNFCAKIADLRPTGTAKPCILNNFPDPTPLGTNLRQAWAKPGRGTTKSNDRQ